MVAVRGEIFAVQAAGQHRDLRMRNARRTPRRADAAHDAVEGFFRALFIFAALRVGDVLHDVQALRTGLGAGVAADAGIDLGIELHHDLLRGLHLLDVVDLLDQREERERRDVHIVLDLCRARETGMQLTVALDAVDRGARAAEAVAAAAATHQLIAGILHGLHDGQACRHLIFFAEQENSYHLFHCLSP